MKFKILLRAKPIFILLSLLMVSCNNNLTEEVKGMKGTVVVAGQPAANVTIILWKTAGKYAAENLLEITTKTDGEFVVKGDFSSEDEDVYYLTTAFPASVGPFLSSIL